MQYVIDELTKSLRYHVRQLEDNQREIENKKETVMLLKQSNVRHEEAIAEITNMIERLCEEHEQSPKD